MTKLKQKISRGADNTAFYSIKDLEKLTGIKAHTIRIWEKRYNVIDPDRTDTNIRRYNDNALKKILLISTLNAQGLKISKLADLSLGELREKVNEITNPSSTMDLFIDQLVVTMVEMDEQAFSNQLQDLINWFGFEKVLTDIYFPFCEKIGIMWLINKIHPAHEHFISNIIRQKLFVEIDKLPVPQDPKAKSVILFLREDELHDIGLLFYNYLFKKSGYKTIYLGQNLPREDLAKVVEFHNAEILITALITKISQTNTQNYISELAQKFGEAKILVSGQHLNEVAIDYPENVRHIGTARELSELIAADSL